MTKRGETLSALFALGLSGASFGSCVVLRELPPGVPQHATDFVCPVLTALIVAGCVLAALHLRAGRTSLGLGTLASILVSIAFSFCILVLGGVDGAFNEDDHFADDLTIPPGLAVREPGRAGEIGHLDDPAGARVVAAAAVEVSSSPSATVELDLPSLARIDETQLEPLRRWLAASPLWHVGDEHGRPIAYRRFETDPFEGFHDSMNGFYGTDVNRRSWRVALGFGGPAFIDEVREGTTRTSTEPVVVALRSASDGFPEDRVSDVVVEGSPLVVEIHERGPDADRPLTRAGLALVEDTVATFLRGEPLSPAAHGSPSLDLSNGMQPGIYEVTAMVSTDEPGTAWVRAYEVTREVELSARSLRDRTARVLPGSSDPTELFRYEAEAMVFEGNWGQPYAARFEVWFAPASGGPERMLISDVFRIEGWMR